MSFILAVKNLEKRFPLIIRKQLDNGLLFFISLRFLGILRDIFLLAEVGEHPDVQNYLIIEPIIYGLGFSTVLIFNSGRYQVLFRFKFIIYTLIFLSIYIPLYSIFLSYFIISFFEKQFSINLKIKQFWKIILIPNILYVIFILIFGLEYFLYFLATISLFQVVYIIELEKNNIDYFDIKSGTSIPFILRPFLISSTRQMIFNANISNYIILGIKIVQQITAYLSSLLIGQELDRKTTMYFVLYIAALILSILSYFLGSVVSAIITLIFVFLLEPFAIKSLKL